MTPIQKMAAHSQGLIERAEAEGESGSLIVLSGLVSMLKLKVYRERAACNMARAYAMS